MRAYILDAYGKGNKLRLGEMSEPVVGPNDVLIQIHAAGLNVIDSKIRNGEFKLILPYKPPFILGADIAGIVTRVGADVVQFAVGDAADLVLYPDAGHGGIFQYYDEFVSRVRAFLAD